MMRRKSVMIITFLLLLTEGFILKGCSFLDVCRTMEVKSNEYAFVYRYGDEKEPVISVGMSRDEVASAWGEPSYNYPANGSKDRYEADEFWVYSKTNSPFITDGEIGYEVYFKDNQVIKILEFAWKKKFVGIEQLR